MSTPPRNAQLTPQRLGICIATACTEPEDELRLGDQPVAIKIEQVEERHLLQSGAQCHAICLAEEFEAKLAECAAALSYLMECCADGCGAGQLVTQLRQYAIHADADE